MPAPIRTPLLIVCAAAALACASDETLAPTSQAKEARVFTSVSIGPASALLWPGETVKLTVIPRDQLGNPMAADAMTFMSSDHAVATVSEAGVVTAVAGGTATIHATATIGGTSRARQITVGVRTVPDPNAASNVLLVFGAHGWDPPVIHVNAGAIVQWWASGMSWAGAPTDELLLLDANYTVIETLDLRSGGASRAFETVGTYGYCSGGCWDPPDFGVIHVH